jgi:hypothetical protein
MTKWAYKVLKIDDSDAYVATIADLGEHGWELVAVVTRQPSPGLPSSFGDSFGGVSFDGPVRHHLIFKREKE